MQETCHIRRNHSCIGVGGLCRVATVFANHLIVRKNAFIIGSWSVHLFRGFFIFIFHGSSGGLRTSVSKRRADVHSAKEGNVVIGHGTNIPSYVTLGPLTRRVLVLASLPLFQSSLLHLLCLQRICLFLFSTNPEPLNMLQHLILCKSANQAISWFYSLCCKSRTPTAIYGFGLGNLGGGSIRSTKY